MSILSFLRRAKTKGDHELAFWRGRHRAEGELNHSHYEQFYTTTFGLSNVDYAGKNVLDIGCGPRGSLEWADMAALRVGLDPLADAYRKLGSDQHRMTYVAAPSESIPFADAFFDVVTSFNSLDHVDDLPATIAEIKRVTKVGGRLLLIVEINHPPTLTEPITLRRELLHDLRPEFATDRAWECAMLAGQHNVYGSVLADRRATDPGEAGILCAALTRVS